MAPDKPSKRPSLWSRMLPALSLMLLAPLMAEVLPGATRYSAMFVFPIEVVVWGGGAVLIREAVRRSGLGWLNLLLLGLALSIAEECVIQQTSLAPMVLLLKGKVWGRAFGVNYVYLLWALAYESVFVVLAPVALTELIFPSRRNDAWLSRGGIVALLVLFCVGCLLAWFSWTQHARPMVFHVPVYNPPQSYMLAAAGVILALILAAIGPAGRLLARPARPARPPAPWLLGLLAAVWAALQFGFVLLGFGIAPDVPPAAAVAAEIVLAVVTLAVLPRFVADPRWGSAHIYAVVTGSLVSSMAVNFVGFIGAAPADFWFKAATNVLAVVLLVVLGLRRLPAEARAEAPRRTAGVSPARR